MMETLNWQTIDLNADLGEGGDHDGPLMALVSSANIACGGHAGDRETIRRAVDLALAHGVAIGAHPGYEDRAHFGRKAIQLSEDGIRDLILRQIGNLKDIWPGIHHVKPHGALYHQANSDPQVAVPLIRAIHEIQPHALLYCPPHGHLISVAIQMGIQAIAEGFLDRRYGSDGQLSPRHHPDAIIENPDEAVRQARRIALHGEVCTLDDSIIPLNAATLCVHGDGHLAVEILTAARNALEQEGILISAPRLHRHPPHDR